MHILKIIHGYPPDYNAGSEVYSQSICNELANRHKITIFTREENPYLPDYSLRREQISPAIQKYVVNKKIDKDCYQHAEIDALLAQILAKSRPDVAHIGHLNHLSTGLIDVLHQHNIPIIFTLHDFWLMCPRGQFLQRNIGEPTAYALCHTQENANCAQRCYSCYFSGQAAQAQADLQYWTDWVAQRMQTTRQLCDKVDLFLAPSRYLQNRFLQDFGLPQAKIRYLDYGFPTEYLSPVQPQPRQCFTFGYIGTHIPAKGINLLINAFSQLQEKSKLIIWGRDNGQSSKYLRHLAAVSPNPIEFRGEYVNKNLAQEVFAHVDAIVVPSIWGENSPLVIHEAQACHIPVITADFGGMSEYVQSQINGLLFAHRDQKALLKQLQYAIQQPQQLKTLGRRGYLYSADGKIPDIQSHCRDLEAIYTSIS
jgi:glycosyltransferase involved in cell wall biosynthesis